MYNITSISKHFPNIVSAQSTRRGGISQAPFNSLNLSFNVGDDEMSVIANRLRFFSSLGISLSQVAISRQMHDDKVLVAEEPGQYEGYDAIITDKKNIFLAVSTADCVPILIYDSVHKCVAAIHAGWKGTVAQIVCKTLDTMALFYNTESKDCYAFIGACIDKCSFEVNNDVSDHFAADLKYFDKAKQKYFVDLKEANKSQLLISGVPLSHIEVSPLSTVIDNALFFSHRKENGHTGRMMAVIGMK